MVFPGDLESTLQELSPSLSPEQVELARLKNAEINTSLGLSPEDPSEDEILEFDIGTNPDESNENYFSEEELARISEKMQLWTWHYKRQIPLKLLHLLTKMRRKGTWK